MMNFSALEPWSVFFISFGAALFLALFVKKLIWTRLLKWSSLSGANWIEILLKRLNAPAKCVVFGLTLSFSSHFVPPSFLHGAFLTLGLKVFFIILLIWSLDRLTKVLLGVHPYFHAITAGTRQLIQFAIRILIFTLGLLVVLDNLGISITPLLASLGVGSVAVALALQDTLNNFFSGVYVLADRPIQIDDYIKLEDGTEGFVARIGWRSTHIRLPSNAMVVVPNSKIASAQLTNYNMPSKETVFRVDVGVGYDSDLKHVERVCLEVAKEVLSHTPSGVAHFQPFVRFHTFADSSINLAVFLQTRHFSESGLLRHEFIKALHEKFRHEKIEIPYPQRVVHNFSPQ
jgi:small-conductance mechanosensitive channel